LVKSALGCTDDEIEADKAEKIFLESKIFYERSRGGRESQPKVSIIVPVYENFSLTCLCLASLFKSNPEISFEVIIADDCSPSNLHDRLAACAPLVRVVKTDGNLGFLKNCNHAAKRASGEFLVFLNNDTIVMPAWLDKLVEKCGARKSTVIVGSKLLNADGTLQEAGGIIWNDGTGSNYGRNDDPSKAIYNIPRAVDYCSGASLCIPKQMWQQLGGFDEHFAPAYCEEVDLCFRAREHGFETIYEPGSALIHLEGASHGTDTTVGLKSYQTRNQEKLRERYSHMLSKKHFSPGRSAALARHRPLSPRLLLLDHMIPEPDRDAGSRSIWHILQTLSRNGYAVYVWPSNGRVTDTKEEMMHRNGFEVLRGPEFKPESFGGWLNANASHFDAFMISRPMVGIDYIDQIRRVSDAPLLYYGHDIHHIRWRRTASHQPPAQAAVSEAIASRNQAVEHYLWEQAETIYYPSDEEVNIVNKYRSVRGLDASAHVIPLNAFDAPEELDGSDYHNRDSLVFVGGFRHPPNEDAVLWFIEQVWPNIRRALPSCRLCIVGSHPTDRILSLKSAEISVLSNISDEDLAAIYRRSLVALAPLRSGGGLKGKITEAMRYGVPVVTTPTGAEGFRSAKDYLHISSDPLEMSRLIINLATDSNEWLRTSHAGAKYIRENFSLEAMWQALRHGLIRN
jgi:GT2 family glycosyltransferase